MQQDNGLESEGPREEKGRDVSNEQVGFDESAGADDGGTIIIVTECTDDASVNTPEVILPDVDPLGVTKEWITN